MTVEASVSAFEVGLAEPVHTARGTVFERRGLVLVLRDGHGRWGRGEVAPLPGWSTIDLDEARQQLDECVAAINAGDAGRAVAEAPEVRAGVDLAEASLRAAQAGQPLWRALGATTGQVPVNALLAGGTAESVAPRAVEAVRAGYRTLKLKLGMGDDAARVSAVVAALDAVPGSLAVALRLDANTAWSAAEAVALLPELASIAGDRLEYVEDPVGSLGELARVRETCSVAVAADELVRSGDDVGAIVGGGLAEVVVVKPPLLGGLTPVLELAARARAGGVDVVVSSLYDGPVGLAGWCHLAAAVGGPRAHGLGTASLLADGGGAHLVPRRGVVEL